MVGAAPPGYERRVWTYTDHAFVEQRATMRQIGYALSSRTVRVARRSVRSAQLHNTANRMRLQSFADYGGHRLPWPSVRYEVTRQDPSNANMGHEPLVSLTSPSFAHYEAAYTHSFAPMDPLDGSRARE